MKKINLDNRKSYVFLFFKRIFTFSLFLPLIFFLGCKKDLSLKVQDKLSEVRYNLFVGKNENFSVKFTSGFREDPYVIDGISESKKEFGVITVKIFNEQNFNADENEIFEYVITINDTDYDGTFEQNPFDKTFVADIETFVLDESKVEIKLTFQGKTFESELVNVSKNFKISHKDALDIFIKEHEKNIENYIKNGINFEIYVKILGDDSVASEQYYFYICLISTNNDTINLIINPQNGEILAKSEGKNRIIL